MLGYEVQETSIEVCDLAWYDWKEHRSSMPKYDAGGRDSSGKQIGLKAFHTVHNPIII